MATKNPYQGDDYDFFEAARDEEGGIRKEKPAVNVDTPKKETFREAFASARKAGKGQLTWNGKKYSTELAKPAAKKPTDTRRMGPSQRLRCSAIRHPTLPQTAHVWKSVARLAKLKGAVNLSLCSDEIQRARCLKRSARWPKVAQFVATALPVAVKSAKWFKE